MTNSELNGPLVYRVTVDIIENKLSWGNRTLDLRNGMTVNAEINVGSRPVISYLFSALSAAWHDSFNEF